jgi:hypothetical protein
MNHDSNTIDFGYFNHYNDDNVLVDYTSLAAKDEDSFDSFDSFQDSLGFSSQSSLGLSDYSGTTTNSGPPISDGRNEDILACTETLDDDAVQLPTLGGTTVITLALPHANSKPPQQPRRLSNATIKRGPVFLTRLFDEPIHSLEPANTDLLDAQLANAINVARAHREIFFVAYGVHNGWMNSLMSLHEIQRYGTPHEFEQACRLISISEKKFALTNRVFGGFIDIFREMESKTGVCEGGVVYPSPLAWSTMQGIENLMVRGLRKLILEQAEKDSWVAEMRRSTPNARLETLVNDDKVIKEYIYGKMKIPLGRITDVRREIITRCIKDGICGSLNVLAPLVSMLNLHMDRSREGAFDHSVFKRVLEIYGKRTFTVAEYNACILRIIRAANTSEEERALMKKRADQQAARAACNEVAENERRLRRNAAASERYHRKKFKMDEKSPFFEDNE